MLQHVMSITLLAAVASATPATSQIRANATIGGRPSAPVPRLMVANPSLATTGDTAAAIAVGDGIRERLTRQVNGTYTVISKRDMNAALATFGFADNELLTASSAMRLAGQLDARVVVTSTLHRVQGGRFQLTLRVANTGGSVDVGHVIVLDQTSGQPLSDLGAKGGEAMTPAIKAWADAKSCLDQSALKPDKAVEAANKAFRTQPGLGLASYCLADMARKKDSVGVATLEAWGEVVKGDPQSLSAWSQIAYIHQIKHDSTKAVETFQQMLRIAPTNQVLRDESYNLFRSYGRPDAAMQVVDEGIRVDPANTDWYDLKSNICLGQEDYGCAITALEEVYAIDSTRADTLFYAKMLYAVKTKPDTAKYVMWAKRGAKKYESRVDVLEELSIAYGWAGQSDSAVAVAQQMLMLDDTKTDAFMRVVRALIEGKQYRQANALAPTVKRMTDQDAKENYAGLMIAAADAFRQVEPVDNELLAAMSDGILSVGSKNTNVNVFASFFLSLALRPGLIEMSTAMRATSPAPTCELARRYTALLVRIDPALQVAATSTTEGVANFAKQLLTSVQPERPWVEQQLTKLCK